MPAPRCDRETKEQYVRRFMASEEAQKDYPDQKQRAAVAHSMWRQRCGGRRSSGGRGGGKLRRITAGG